MKRFYYSLLITFCCMQLYAQPLVKISWTAYGLNFMAPRGIMVEEDTEESFLVNNNKYYITIQSIDSDGLTMEDLPTFVTDYAKEDGMKQMQKPATLDFSQFDCVYVKGKLESDDGIYACLMTKDAGNVFFVSIVYTKDKEQEALTILKSFTMDEE